jgi:hypothetical protein
VADNVWHHRLRAHTLRLLSSETGPGRREFETRWLVERHGIRLLGLIGSRSTEPYWPMTKMLTELVRLRMVVRVARGVYRVTPLGLETGLVLDRLTRSLAPPGCAAPATVLSPLTGTVAGAADPAEAPERSRILPGDAAAVYLLVRWHLGRPVGQFKLGWSTDVERRRRELRAEVAPDSWKIVATRETTVAEARALEQSLKEALVKEQIVGEHLDLSPPAAVFVLRRLGAYDPETRTLIETDLGPDWESDCGWTRSASSPGVQKAAGAAALLTGRIQVARYSPSGCLWWLKLQGEARWRLVARSAAMRLWDERCDRLRPGEHVLLRLGPAGLVTSVTLDGYGAGGMPHGLGDVDQGLLRVTHQRIPRSPQPY